MTKTSKEESVLKYVKEKHTQEECIGFIDGWEAQQKEIDNKDQEIKRLRKACEIVVSGYETDGMEQMEARDEVFYESCKKALKQNNIE